MAHQPLYATVRDTNATRHTTSLRSRVEWINFWLNSHFGSVMNVSASSKGSLDKKSVYEAKEKIKEWTEKNKPKRVKIWEQKLKERKEYNAEQEKKEEVTININVNDNPKFKICFNGIYFSPADLKLLDQTKQRDFLGKLGIASAFALIPNIKRIVNEPTKKNIEEFKQKKDNISKFLKEEEAKLKV